ncbi:hypothetical protein APTSU1_001666100 [Apodemus speciosus]|uniref:Uncharacterized protein n=1 Tax=Apodemus speciosus TaxID=105296 RepID=A0ABQ0FQA3_APOSI
MPFTAQSTEVSLKIPLQHRDSSDMPCTAQGTETSLKIPLQHRDSSDMPCTAQGTEASLKIPLQHRDSSDMPCTVQGTEALLKIPLQHRDSSDMPCTAQGTEASLKIPLQHRDSSDMPCTAQGTEASLKIPLQHRDSSDMPCTAQGTEASLKIPLQHRDSSAVPCTVDRKLYGRISSPPGLRESLAMLKAAKKMRCRIQRIELENSNLVVTIEKQAREMEALGEKLSHAGVNVVETAPAGEPGETRENVAQMELMELTSELAKVRMQEDSCKMEVQKYKELYLKELRKTCKCSEQSCSHYEEEMRWKTSSMVALVGPHPECPQVPYLTSSTMEPQGNAPQPSQCPEARCEFMENPRSWSEDKEKARLELISSVRSLLCALHQETRRTRGLKKELAELSESQPCEAVDCLWEQVYFQHHERQPIVGKYAGNGDQLDGDCGQ